MIMNLIVLIKLSYVSFAFWTSSSETANVRVVLSFANSTDSATAFFVDCHAVFMLDTNRSNIRLDSVFILRFYLIFFNKEKKFNQFCGYHSFFLMIN
ncbi:hypothetical protein TRFO_26764 [Tritrichomonas foetus]|uniref:Secreted protein n=1 Tax=Tritrichomonas foetus TaxID=1144522 RepID=A0A1J4K716_9EUKA|nr:hypothetical protein TRFO_26764 [Tritrichomonas foetus]|eukprot:OHT05492.1 hypothetical protein TRFO_26764 [Tritrichomonas foetus]